MAYRLRSGELIPDGTRRIVLEQIDAVVHRLGGKAPSGSESIHEVRKSIKSIRSALRFLRSELGDGYGLEMRLLRGLGRRLADLRDANAMIQSFDRTRRKCINVLPKPTFDTIRLSLDRHKKDLNQKTILRCAFNHLVETFLTMRERVSAWVFERNGFSAIGPGIRRTFRRGQKAFHRAHSSPRSTNFHEWRKRVKDLSHLLLLFKCLWSPRLKAYEKSLKDLESILGREHDGAVLRRYLVRGRAGNKEEIGSFLSLANRQEKKMREKALSIGKTLYRESPRSFTAHMKLRWKVWKHNT